MLIKLQKYKYSTEFSKIHIPNKVSKLKIRFSITQFNNLNTVLELVLRFIKSVIFFKKTTFETFNNCILIKVPQIQTDIHE